MTEEANLNARSEEAESAQSLSDTPKKTAFLGRFLTRKWIAIVLVASIVIHGLGFVCYRLLGKASPVSPSPEVSLGGFQFEADGGEFGGLARAEFSLHIALLEHVEQEARRRLQDRRFRVQQDVEELLRRAHRGDFDDPGLGELKRQLQEQVNETLGMRAIADVIITDLRLKPREKDIGSVTDTAEVVPWVEKPSG